MKIFIGYDPREAQAYHVCAQSIIDHASQMPQIVPLDLRIVRAVLGYEETHAGTNAFIHSRFLVPALCDFSGLALYIDADMLFRCDPMELFRGADLWKALHVVQHDYTSQHARKYIGSAIEADNLSYPRKNWSSLILWNCGHYANRALSPRKVQEMASADLHRFTWLKNEYVGELDAAWNVLVGEQTFRADAKLVHYTLGVPTLDGGHYMQCDYADEWHQTAARASRCG